MYIVGIGSVKTKINVEGSSSKIKVAQGDDFQIIVKAVDNQSDPMSIINVFQFDVSKSARKAEMASLATFGGQNNNKLKLVEYTAKKYGENSYILTEVELMRQAIVYPLEYLSKKTENIT